MARVLNGRRTKLGQLVLDTLCEFEAEHGHYGIGGCFFALDLRQVSPSLVTKGISPAQLGGIIKRLLEQGYLYDDEAVDPWDIWITNEGWMAWSEWKDEHLLDLLRTEPGQDWCWEMVLPQVSDVNLRAELQRRLGNEEVGTETDHTSDTTGRFDFGVYRVSGELSEELHFSSRERLFPTKRQAFRAAINAMIATDADYARVFDYDTDALVTDIDVSRPYFARRAKRKWGRS